MTPVIIFAYKRPDTTQQLLRSLLSCPECKDTELYVFIDGPKKNDDIQLIEQTRQLFDDITGFKSKHVLSSPVNKGLATSVIEGVSQIVQKSKRIIVLEDDLIVAPDFLTFMNQALEIYENNNSIWSISGYTPNITNKIESTSQVFLTPRAQCWGWATWADRWQLVDWDVKDFALMKNRAERKAFNQGGNDLYPTLDMERHGKIESWAIRWAYAAYRNHMWTINPIGSKVQNIGFQTNASHQGWHDERHKVDLYLKPISCDPNPDIDPQWIKAFKSHNDLNPVSKIGFFLRRYNLGYHQIKRLIHH